MALAVFDALTDMVQRCASDVEELALRRKAYDLIIAMRTDEFGANEENIQPVCAALQHASAIQIGGFDEETFWIEITIPGVFETDDFDVSNVEKTLAGQKYEPVPTEMPEWFLDAMQAVKEKQAQLSPEDFATDQQRMGALADIYGVFKRIASAINAELVFSPPKLPMNEHGSCNIVARKLVMSKSETGPLFSCIAKASSFGIDYCADNRVRLSAGISFVYNCRD